MAQETWVSVGMAWTSFSWDNYGCNNTNMWNHYQLTYKIQVVWTNMRLQTVNWDIDRWWTGSVSYPLDMRPFNLRWLVITYFNGFPRFLSACPTIDWERPVSWLTKTESDINKALFSRHESLWQFLPTIALFISPGNELLHIKPGTIWKCIAIRAKNVNMFAGKWIKSLFGIHLGTMLYIIKNPSLSLHT